MPKADCARPRPRTRTDRGMLLLHVSVLSLVAFSAAFFFLRSPPAPGPHAGTHSAAAPHPLAELQPSVRKSVTGGAQRTMREAVARRRWHSDGAQPIDDLDSPFLHWSKRERWAAGYPYRDDAFLGFEY